MKKKEKKKQKTMLRLLKYAFKNKLLVAIAFIFSLIANSFAISAPFIIGKAIDLMTEAPVDLSTVLIWCMILLSLYLISALFNFLTHFVSYFIAGKAVYNLRKDMYLKMTKMSVKFFDTTSHGEIMQRMTSDMDYILDGLYQLITQFFGGFVSIVGIIVFMILLNFYLALFVILFTPLCFLFSKTVIKRSAKFFKQQTKTAADLNSYLDEVVNGQKTIRAFSFEEQSFEKYKKINDELYDSGQKSQFYSSIVNPLSRTLNYVIYIAIGVFGGLLSINRLISVGKISSFLSYSIQFSQPINNITAVSTQLQNASASAYRIFEILDKEIETPDSESAVMVLPYKKTVNFENISFSYNKNKKLIENFSLKVKTGMKVAIVGRTGSGKTTLVNLLMRFYDVDKGQIKICDIDTQDIKRSILRKSFAMVLQETWLKSGTILCNITYGKKDVKAEDIENVIKLSGCDSFINKLPDRLNTEIAENDRISSGQKQLITIARAMLNLPDLLILDEATSSVDILTEQKIGAAFDNMTKNRTSFVIAHRLSTIKNCDIILVLEDGNIVEKGSHEELIKNSDGFYYKLYNSQFEALS